jgi:hypothetical protein
MNKAAFTIRPDALLPLNLPPIVHSGVEDSSVIEISALDESLGEISIPDNHAKSKNTVVDIG